MKVTYLAHASLLVETGGVRLVTDPWLVGPTYLSSWWHFPEPVHPLEAILPVDFVYITHEHLDHFHEPTLARLPRSTPILIGRFLTPRFRRLLERLGFTDVRELPHGEAVRLAPGVTATSYQYRADDTALVLEDGEATLLDLNDCLLRARSLDQVLERFPRIDLCAASFANAEAYPIVYSFDDPAERTDWDDQSRFDNYLARLRRIGPKAFVPFASMFCFLSDDLFPINERIVSPAGLIDRARRGEAGATPIAMNPGDTWTPADGHQALHPVDWSRKPELLVEMAARRRPELARIQAAERVHGGAEALGAAFRAFFTGFAHRVPPVVRRRLELSVRFDVTGPAGQTLWLRFAKGRLDLAPPARDDDFDVRITIGDWPLWRMVERLDTWQTLGVSCRFRVHLRPGAREREVLLWFLLYLDDLGYLEARRLLHPRALPRALDVLGRRRRELLEYAGGLFRGRFVEQNLRSKFEV